MAEKNHNRKNAIGHLIEAKFYLVRLGDEAKSIIQQYLGDILILRFSVPNPAKTFRWSSPSGTSFTVRPQPGNRQGGVYWSIRKYHNKKLHFRYIGKNLTEEKLSSCAEEIEHEIRNGQRQN